MNDFDTRWRSALDAARGAPSRDDTTPFGFASRVVALRRNAPAASTFLLWWKFTWRAIGVAALALVASAAMNWTFSNDSALDPAIADSMNDLMWLP
jgi:uncharacterized iron-regulated membrane protein